ncbi:MAG TPA: MOSC N-terminal beta barrel domain-containing protein [Actinophytocola sp.]|uniref:MOSC domain-containing protein n=1 Tax=Actinophytocola sp. TaxID=1872138 RepID=UPI002DB9B3AE|nr:MOSC N-terminal beta barrel domain-containing protein [Actinophytocola sp.]HEU5471063.1 MOSC N-terminal beta barrel domain-containing protein [Actinophytocola sp.]
MAVVSGLVCYPIKGCAGVVLERSEVTPAGLTHDRTFAVVDRSGASLWQGAVPRMATVRGRVLGAGIVLSAPGADDLEVDAAAGGRTLAVEVEKWPGRGIDQGDAAAEWLSELLDVAVRLVREPPGARTGADPTALLITSRSSLDGLNTRILARGAPPVPMNRFRPNMIVTGWAEAHTEDRVARMTAGTAEFGFGELAIRCAITMVDQLAGVRAGPEPLRTLADYRREPDGVTFGMKATVHTPGHVAVGDPVTITERRSTIDSVW